MKMIMAFCCCLVLASCSLAGVPIGPSGAVGAAALSDQVMVKSTTALSLAELAYNSGEAAATAVLKSGLLKPAQAGELGALVHSARSYRDQARSLVAAGQDATAVLNNLASSLANVAAITGKH